MHQETGKYLLIAGIVLLVLGTVVYFFSDKLNLIGKLPGDIRLEGEKGSFYFPITTCILLSILLTLLLKLYHYFMK
jgi:hypothetical protein